MSLTHAKAMRRKSISAAMGALALFIFPATGMAVDFLSGEQVTSAFSGKTVEWKHLKKNRAGKTYYAADGKITGVSNGTEREGSWHVDGDKLCVSWGKCLQIEADGEGGYYKVKKGSIRVVHLTNIKEGNAL